jgi:hypothetical protein
MIVIEGDLRRGDDNTWRDVIAKEERMSRIPTVVGLVCSAALVVVAAQSSVAMQSADGNMSQATVDSIISHWRAQPQQACRAFASEGPQVLRPMRTNPSDRLVPRAGGSAYRATP